MTRDEYRAVLEKQFDVVFKNKLLPVDAKTQMEWMRLRTAWLSGALKLWDALKCESLTDIMARTTALGQAAVGVAIGELMDAQSIAQFDAIVRASAWKIAGVDLSPDEQEAQALFSDTFVDNMNALLIQKRRELLDMGQP